MNVQTPARPPAGPRDRGDFAPRPAPGPVRYDARLAEIPAALLAASRLLDLGVRGPAAPSAAVAP